MMIPKRLPPTSSRRHSGPLAILAGALAASAFTFAPATAGTMATSASPPVVDGFDIANYGAVTGNEKWWAENNTGAGSCKGQSFTTGPAAVELRSISYQVTSSQQAQPTKTYVVRVGTVAGTTFTEIHSETFTQGTGLTWNGGEFMMWTFDNPPVLTGNTTYAVDIGMTSSTSNWQTGIPYINVTANSYSGGERYSAGQFGVGDSDMHTVPSGDRIFHLDLGIPAGTGLQFVGGNPADDSTGALIAPELTATFNQNLVAGTGNITIRDLTGSIDTSVAVGDPRISLSDNLLLIETPGLIDWNKSYAIRIDAGALESDTGDVFAGINDDDTWNFTTALGDPLLLAVQDLKDHINGAVTLSAAEIDAHKQTIDANKQRFDESATVITALFDLVTTYDNVIGPLWIARGQFDRNNQVNDLDWTIYHVMQYIMDQVYNAGIIAAHEALLDGYVFGSSAHFPGSVAPPANPNNTHSVLINASFPDTFGRHTQQWTLPARKPTGTYLAPGTIATVTVPPALVGQGFQVRVGAHSWDLTNRRWVRRLDRATILYDLDAPTIKVASPYGGGIYIEVPMHANAGVVSVDITGAVRAPYFSAKSFHTTTNAEWTATERNHPAPWADFQTDKFMMQVPTDWINNMPDPAAVMAEWDGAMDAINDLMGFPQIRGKETMYIQVDLLLRSSVHAPGYPAVNVTYNPNSNYNGNVNSYFVQGPQSGASTEFHEQGHAYFFPKFGGETEANVNLLYVPVLNRVYGMSLDDAFRASTGFPGATTDPLDKTAVLWMTSFNYAPREEPMASWEKAYQPQGHAKWVDIARLFGWDGLGAYWESFMVDDANGTPYSNNTDSLLLRLCKHVGQDIRPLFHFWGIHPQNPAQLASDVAAEGLTPPVEIYDLLVHYKSLVPADNAEYRAFCLDWYSGVPSIGGYGVEREHTRQWDNTSYWQANGWQYSGTAATNPDGTPVVDDGEIYLEASATRLEDRTQELIDLYFPGGRPASDYENWSAYYPGHDLTDPNADLDGDGLSNDYERIFGLDPTDAGSQNAIVTPLAPDGSFQYTRRNPSLTGQSYAVWYSTDLIGWDEDTGAAELPGPPDAQDVETVAMSVSPGLLIHPRLFIQVRAE